MRNGYIISPNLNMSLWLQSEPYDFKIGPQSLLIKNCHRSGFQGMAVS